MASGLPIISTAVPAVPEVVGDAGLLVPPKRPDILAERILQVLEDVNLRKQLIINGFRRVKGYSWENIIVMYEKAYKYVVGQRRK
jgi:glycosyltransferase involved in cell wall biosynthesis